MKDSAIISGNINIVVAATPYSIETVSNIAFLFSPGIPVIMENNTVITSYKNIIPIEPINTIEPYTTIIDTIPCLPIIMEYDTIAFSCFGVWSSSPHSFLPFVLPNISKDKDKNRSRNNTG